MSFDVWLNRPCTNRYGSPAGRLWSRTHSKYASTAEFRDETLLDSALGRPRQQWAYENPPRSIIDLAAAYAFGLVKNHPFYDGNKRTAAVVCEAFLNQEGVWRTASDDDWYAAIMTLAAGESSEQDFRVWLRAHCEPGAKR